MPTSSSSLVFLERLVGYVVCGLLAIIGFVVVWKIASGQIDISKILTEKDGSAEEQQACLVFSC